jgi:hypothetical protein
MAPIALLALHLAACHRDPDPIETADTGVVDAWWEEVPAEPHVHFHWEGAGIDRSYDFPASQLVCGDRLELPGNWLEVFWHWGSYGDGDMAICQIDEVTGRVTAIDETELIEAACADHPGWWFASWNPDISENVGWATLPEGDEFQDCWMDVHFEDPELVTRFQCPYVRALYSGPEPLPEGVVSITGGHSRCEVVAKAP